MHIAEQEQTVSPVNGVKSSMIASRELLAELVFGEVWRGIVCHLVLDAWSYGLGREVGVLPVC